MSFQTLPLRVPKRRRSTRPANARKFRTMHFDLSHITGCYNNVMRGMAARFLAYGITKEGELTELPEQGLFMIRFKGPQGVKEEVAVPSPEKEEKGEKGDNGDKEDKRRHSTGGKRARRLKKHHQDKKNEKTESSKAKDNRWLKDYLYLVFRYNNLYLTGLTYKGVYYKLKGIEHDISDLVRTEKKHFYQQKRGEESIKKKNRRQRAANGAARRAARRANVQGDADAHIDDRVAIALGAKRCCVLPFGENYQSLGVDFSKDITAGGPALLEMFEALTSIEKNLDGHHGRLQRALRTAIVMFSEAGRFPCLQRLIAFQMKQTKGEMNATISCTEAKAHFKNWANYCRQIRKISNFVETDLFSTLTDLTLFLSVLLWGEK